MRALHRALWSKRSTLLHAPRPLAMVLAAATLAVASFGLAPLQAPAAVPAADTPTAAVELPIDAASEARPLDEIDAAIEAWTANLAAEPADFISSVHVAELYLARVRVSGDVEDATRAADAADQALAIDGELVAARLLRAQAAQAGHDFAGAAAGALAVLEVAPDAPEALALLGDARLEQRHYDEARATYDRLAEVTDGSAVEARFAVLAMDEGRLEEAAGRAAAATASALAEAQPSTAMAWYYGLEGIIALQTGDLVASEAAWRSALAAWSSSPHALAGLGQTLAATGDLQGARAALERAVAIRLLPDALSSLADVQDALGDREAAAATRETLAALQAAGSVVSDRAAPGR